MKCCHSNLHRPALGLFCLLVTGCNGWPSPTSPPQSSVNPTSIEITEEVDQSVSEPVQPDRALPLDQAADSPIAAEPTGVRALRPYYEWTDSETAADSLGRMGPAAVPPLMQTLDDPNPAVRALACRVLSRIGPEAVIAVPDLIRLLDDKNEQVRREATRALGQIGPAATESIPALVRLLEESQSTPSDDLEVTVELDESTTP